MECNMHPRLILKHPKVAALWDEGAGALVIPGDLLPSARLEVKRTGSALYKLSRKVAKKLTEK